MNQFHQTLKHWMSDIYVQSLKADIARVDVNELPLLKATSYGGVIRDKAISITVLSSKEAIDVITIVTGVFFVEISPSCNCSEDPMEVNSYCELEITINKSNAETHFKLLNSKYQSDI